MGGDTSKLFGQSMAFFPNPTDDYGRGPKRSSTFDPSFTVVTCALWAWVYPLRRNAWNPSILSSHSGDQISCGALGAMAFYLVRRFCKTGWKPSMGGMFRADICTLRCQIEMMIKCKCCKK